MLHYTHFALELMPKSRLRALTFVCHAYPIWALMFMGGNYMAIKT